jgi:transketolase
MRNAFIEELVLAAEENENVVLVVGDLGYGVIEPFLRKFPERFFNAGVAEQNMMGMCAGLASEGFHVFAYSIANFPTFRCAEQIRNDIDYHNLPVTVVTVGGGLAYGNLGYSHHAIQDYALMRSMPNMLIASPGDPMEVRACLRYLIHNPQPSYLRLGKSGEPCCHLTVPTIAPGKWVCVRRGTNLNNTYLTTGAAMQLVVHSLETTEDISNWSLHSLPLWSMNTKIMQPAQLAQYSTVVTVEDHLMDGGFGSWMLEGASSSTDLLMRVHVKALNSDICGLVGKQSTLNIRGGLGNLVVISEHS